MKRFPSHRYFSDAQLLKALKTGDATAVTTWYQQYHDKLFRFVKKKIDSEKDAEELVQDTFLSCLKHLPLFRGEAGVWTWMVRIAHHEIADYYRKRYAKKFIQALPLSDLLPITSVRDAHEVSQRVKAVLQEMTSEHREVLLLKYVDRKQVQQIAKELGKTAKSIESLLFRARAEFRALYALQANE